MGKDIYERIINYKSPIINIVDKTIWNGRKLDKKMIINLIISIIEVHFENTTGDYFENEEIEIFRYKIRNGDILGVFYDINKEIRLAILIDIFEFIDINGKYELFKNVYLGTIINANLNNLLNSLKILKTDADLEYLKNVADEKGYLTIYRGEGSLSQYLENGGNVYSWSLDKQIAREFANRFSKLGVIYTAKIKVNDVSAYITERNENEIVALLKDIKIINKEESVSNLFK